MSDNFKFRHITYRFKNTANVVMGVIDDYRPSEAVIECAGLPSLHRADVKIYYMQQNLMNKLSFLNYRNLDLSNMVMDIMVDKQLAFSGDMVNCEPIYDTPNPYLKLQAMTAIK